MEEEEEDIMEYQSFTRKQLQTLCKRHGIPANLTNREMADRLSSIPKEIKELTSQGKSLGEILCKKVNGNGSKAKTSGVKKVRFSPENETFFYEISGYKRGGRRKCMMKSLPKKKSQSIENDVSAPPPAEGKRVKRDVKHQSLEMKNATDCDVEMGERNVGVGLIRRQLRNREVVVVKSDGDLVVSGKNVKQRSSKIGRNDVPEENLVVRDDDKVKKISKTGGRFTRSRALDEGRDSEIGEDRGVCEKVPQLEEPSKGVGRNVLGRKSDEAEMGLRKTKQEAAKDGGSEMLSGNSRKVGSVTTRSQEKTAGVACAAESKNEEETIQPYKGKVRSVGVKEKKETRKRSRNSDLEGVSGLEAIRDTSKVLEMVKNVNVPCGPSRRTRRQTVTLNSTVSDYVELETEQNIGPKDARLSNNVLRRSRRIVMNGAANNAEQEKVSRETELNVVKDQGSEILSGNPRFRSVNEIINSRTKTVGKATAAESETLEDNVQLEEHSKGLVRHTSRRKSVFSQKIGSDGVQEKEENRKQSRNDDLEGVLELEAFVEPHNEVEMVKNVSVSSGPSRRTRHNTVMLKYSISANELSENHQIARQKDIRLIKNLRKSSRIAANSAVTSSEVDGTSDAVGKVRQKKQRPEVIEDEPLTKRPLKRLTRFASKIDLVEPADATINADGKKRDHRSKMPNTEQKAPCSEKLSAAEDGRIAVEEAVNYENKANVSNSKHVSGSSGRKWEANNGKLGSNNQHGSIKASTVNSDTEDTVDYAVNLKDALVSTSVKLLSVSTDQVKQNSVRNMVLLEEFSVVGDILDVDRDDKSCWSVNEKDDLGDGNMVEHEMTTSPAADFSPSNQSTDSAEPLNFVDLKKVNGAEEQLHENISHRSENVDDQSIKDDKSSVQEFQNLDQGEDNKETTAEPLVQEEVLEKKSEISQGKGKIDPSNVARICHSECFPEPIKMQDFTVESCLVARKIDTERTTETQLHTYVDDVTEATLCKLAVKSQEVDEAKEQNIDQSTVLEISNANFLGQEEFFADGTNFFDERTTSGCETSISNAGSGIFSLAKTEDNVTTNRIESEETFHDERVSQVIGEKFINDGSEGNLCLGSSAIPVSIEIDGIDAKKENAVSERYSHDATENENEVSEQNPNNVFKETGGKPMCELSDAAVRSSELVLEKIYGGEELVWESNCSVDIIVEDVPFNEVYAAKKGIGGKRLNGESDFEQCADVAKEDIPDCAPKIELGDKSDHEVVASQVNGNAGTSLTEFISKESEFSGGKAVETMMKRAEYIEVVDNSKVEISKFKDSVMVVNDAGALAQVSGNHLVEHEDMEELDGFIQNDRIEADAEAQTMATKGNDFLDEAGNIETLASVSPMILWKSFGDEFVNDKGMGVLNKVKTANVEDLEDRANDVMGFVPHVDEVNIGDLDTDKKKNASDLERRSFVTSVNVMSTFSEAADIKEKVETKAADLISNDDSSDSEKEDDVYAIPQVTEKDTEYDLPELELCNAEDNPQRAYNYISSHIGAAADYAVEVSEDGVNDILDMGLPFKADDQVTKEKNLTDQIVDEGLNDSMHGLNTEDNAGTVDKQPNHGVGTASNNLSCSNRRKIITEVADDEVQSDKLGDMIVTDEELPDIPSVTPRMSGDCSAISPTIAISSHVNDGGDMGSPFKADDRVTEEKNLTDQIVDEGLNDSMHGLNTEDNAGTVEKQPNHGMVCSISDDLSCSNTRKIITEVADGGVHSDKLCDRVVIEGIGKLPAIPSVTTRISGGCSAVSPTIALSKYVNDSVDMGSPFRTEDQVTEEENLMDQIVDEGLNDSIHGLNTENNEGAADKQPILSMVCSTSNNLSCSNKRTNITEIAEEGVHSDKLCDTVVTEDIEDLPAFPSETPRMSVDVSAVSPTTALTKCVNDAVDMSLPFKTDGQVTEEENLMDQIVNEGLNDSIHGLNTEDNEGIADKQPNFGMASSTSNNLSSSNRREIITELAVGVRSGMLGDTVVTEDIENLPAIPSVTHRLSGEWSAVSPTIALSKDESKSLGFHCDVAHLTSWEMNKIFGSGDPVDVKKSAGGISEANTMAQDCEGAVHVKENLSITEPFDRKETENHLNEQESHTHQAFSDEPIRDNEVLDEKNELSAFNQEHIDYEIKKDKAYVPAEELVIEATATRSSNIADLDGFKAEYVYDDPKTAKNIAVDPAVLGCSRSGGNSMDTEATKTMDAQEVENVETTKPVTPKELCAGCENDTETSNVITGTILQQIFSTGSGCKEKNFKVMSKGEEHNEDYSNYGGRKEMADEDIGNICSDMASLFQDNIEARIGKSKAADSLSLENDSLEVIKDRLEEHEGSANEASFRDGICCLGQNQLSCGKKSKGHEIETEDDGLDRPEDEVGTAGNSKKVMNLEISYASSPSIPEMAISPVTFSSKSVTEDKPFEHNAESLVFTDLDTSLLSEPCKNDGVENSEAVAVEFNFIGEDARDVKDNAMIMEEISTQVTEEQIPEHKTAEDVSKLKSYFQSDVDEPTSKDGKASTEENMLNIVQGAFENTNSTAGTDTVADDPWKLELKLLSPQPQPTSPESKTGRKDTSFARNLNSSTRKPKNKSTLIQRTPKPKLLVHDMKENLLSTNRGKTSNITSEKTLSKRRALEDLRKK